jgi:hypothetical protein
MEEFAYTGERVCLGNKNKSMTEIVEVGKHYRSDLGILDFI